MDAPTIISLVGRQGSGKSTIGRKLGRLLGTEQLETSDVVKDLCGDLERSDLPLTGRNTKKDPDWLGRAVHNRLLRAANRQQSKSVVLTGVREMEVHLYLQAKGVPLYIFEILTDPFVRYTRLKRLGKVDTAKDFIDQELRETDLGVQEVCDKAPFRVISTNKSDPAGLARAITGSLKKRDIEL